MLALALAGIGMLQRIQQGQDFSPGHCNSCTLQKVTQAASVAGWSTHTKGQHTWKPPHSSSSRGSNLLVFIRICLVLSQPIVGFKGDLFFKQRAIRGVYQRLAHPPEWWVCRAHHSANQNYSSTGGFLFLSLHLQHTNTSEHPQALKPPISQYIHTYIHTCIWKACPSTHIVKLPG